MSNYVATTLLVLACSGENKSGLVLTTHFFNLFSSSLHARPLERQAKALVLRSSQLVPLFTMFLATGKAIPPSSANNPLTNRGIDNDESSKLVFQISTIAHAADPYRKCFVALCKAPSIYGGDGSLLVPIPSLQPATEWSGPNGYQLPLL